MLASPGHDLDVTFESAEDAVDNLLSPAAGIALALLIRVGTSGAGLVAALPMMHAFDAEAGAPGRYSGSRLARLLDRLSTARGFSRLRFTRYVRDAAVLRLEEAGARYERIDRAFTVASFVLPGVFVLVLVVILAIG